MSDQDDNMKHTVTMTISNSGVVDFKFINPGSLGIGKMERFLRRANRFLRTEQLKIRRENTIKDAKQAVVNAEKQIEIDKQQAKVEQVAAMVLKNPDKIDAIAPQVQDEIDRKVGKPPVPSIGKTDKSEDK